MRTLSSLFVTLALGLACNAESALDDERTDGGRQQDGQVGTGGGAGAIDEAGAAGAASDAAGGAGGSNGSGGSSATVGECAELDNCNTACAKTGESCTGDCDVECGFNGIGNKHCTCVEGIYIQCPCPRPPEFDGPETALYCDVLLGGDGMMASYKDGDCDTEWKACVARDPNTGTPRGCVCMKDPDAHLALRWSCGSTNKWFAPEPSRRIGQHASR
jgi:hypothetical protein